MKILIAPDKFKGSLSAQKIATAIAKGIHQSYPTAEIVQRPMADGGDGSLAVLSHYFNLKTTTISVADPLMRPTEATYKTEEKTAYIELATASGLALLKPAERDARLTSTFGTGQLIKDALQKGATKIYLFIGGSATNDGGIGIAQALGYRFLDINGKDLEPIGNNLIYIEKIDNSQLLYDFSNIDFQIICDVNSPFFGKNGAAQVYAPQKGATIQDVEYLDKGLQNLAQKLTIQGYPTIENISGAGAAGGVGGGMMAFCQAKLVSGISLFLETTELEKIIQDCDIVVTGEGKLDAQTKQGKVISGICALAKKYKKPVIAVCGAAENAAVRAMEIFRIFTILERSKSLEEAMTNTAQKLEEIGVEIGVEINH